LGWEGPLEVI